MKKSKAKAKPRKKTAAHKKVKRPATKKVKAAAKPRAAAKAPKSARKTVRKKKKTEPAAPKRAIIAPANSVLLGYVEDYFAKIGVIALTLEAALAQGRRIQVLGHTTNFEQPVESMQIDHQPVALANPGDGVGIKVTARARAGDHVYLLL